MEQNTDILQVIKLKVKHLLEENTQLKKQILQLEQQTQALAQQMTSLQGKLKEDSNAKTAISLLQELAPTPNDLEILDEELKRYIKHLNKSIELLSATQSEG
jgi:predicted  nucleic acid-binding Zn-ribbon protein